MSNSQNVNVNAEIEVAANSHELVNANIRTEQQLNLGHHAIRVLTGEKRDEIGEVMASTRKRVSELAAEVSKAEEVVTEATKKHVKSLEKKKEKLQKDLASQIFSMTRKLVTGSFTNISLTSKDEDEEKPLKAIESSVLVDVNQHGVGGTIFVNVKYGQYSKVLNFEVEHDAATRKAIAALKVVQKQRDEAVAFSAQLQEALAAVDKYERKLELDLSKSALRHSEDGAAILEALRKVAFPNTIPALPWSGKRK